MWNANMDIEELRARRREYCKRYYNKKKQREAEHKQSQTGSPHPPNVLLSPHDQVYRFV